MLCRAAIGERRPTTPYVSKKLSVLRLAAVVSIVLFHGVFEPGTLEVTPPAGSAAGFVEAYISLALMRWALPFLGLVSGYLFFRHLTPSPAGFTTKLRSRVHTLLVPFLIWSGLGVLLAVALTHTRFGSLDDSLTILSVGEALDHWLLHPVLYPLWFLQALMACMVLSPLVYVAVRTLGGLTLLIAVAWWVTGWQPDVLWPWISSTAFPPFIIGATIAILGWKAPWRTKGHAPAWLAAAVIPTWLAVAALYTLYGDELGRWMRAGLLPVVVLGVLAVWLGFDVLRALLGPSPRLVTAALFVAPLSFFVYVSQEPTLGALITLVRAPYQARASDTGAGSQLIAVLLYLGPPVITVAASLAAALVLRRLLPRVYAVMTGGRGPRNVTAGVTVGDQGRRAGGPQLPDAHEELAPGPGAP